MRFVFASISLDRFSRYEICVKCSLKNVRSALWETSRRDLNFFFPPDAYVKVVVAAATAVVVVVERRRVIVSLWSPPFTRAWDRSVAERGRRGCLRPWDEESETVEINPTLFEWRYLENRKSHRCETKIVLKKKVHYFSRIDFVHMHRLVWIREEFELDL